MKYNNEIIKDNVVYSVDMLRFHFDIKNDEKSLDYIEFLKQQFVILGADYWMSFRMFNYKYLYTLNGVTVGLLFNGAKNADNFKGFIEFNPNKYFNEFENIANLLNKITKNTIVKSYDLAVDFKIHKSNMFFIKDMRNYRYFEKYVESANTFSVTEYLGKRGSNGYSKLYNKSVESNLDYDLTRLEISLTDLTYLNLVKKLPKIMYFENNLINKYTTTLQELIKMCYQYQDFTSLSFLSKYQKNEIKELSALDFDYDIDIFNKLVNYIIKMKNML